MKPSSKPSGLFMLVSAVLFAVLFASLAPHPARADEGAVAAPKAGSRAKVKASPKVPAAKGAQAMPTGEVTLKGQLTCAKCGLHESSVCQNVLRVPDPAGKAETKYYLTKNDVAQAHHEEVCGNQVSATVTGRVSEEAGKKVLTASAVTLD